MFVGKGRRFDHGERIGLESEMVKQKVDRSLPHLPVRSLALHHKWHMETIRSAAKHPTSVSASSPRNVVWV